MQKSEHVKMHKLAKAELKGKVLWTGHDIQNGT